MNANNNSQRSCEVTEIQRGTPQANVSAGVDSLSASGTRENNVRPSGALTMVEKGTEISPPSPKFEELFKLANGLTKSGLFPHIKDPYQALAIIEYGRELGLMPVASLQTIKIIKGNLCMEAKAMLALLHQRGIRVTILEKTKQRCRLKFEKPGWAPHVEEFNIDDAKRLGFLDKDNWKNYPEEMCFWRCVAKGARAYDPGSILGLYAVEEVEDFPEPSTPYIPVKQEPASKPTKPPKTQRKEKEKLDPEAERLAKLINEELHQRGIDSKKFKEFMFKNQEHFPERQFVGLYFGHPSFSKGNPEDLKYLLENLNVFIELFKAHEIDNRNRAR